MKKSKKRVAFILTLVMIAGCLFGCRAKSEKKDVDSNGEKTITVWHYANDREDLLNQLAEEYYQETGIKVVMELYSGDQMASKIRTAASSGELPDAWYFAGGKGDMDEYATAGNIKKIEADWLDRFPENVLAQVSFTDDDTYDTPAGTYGIPFDLNNMQMVYNKDLFEQAGIGAENIPETWEEFIDVCKKLKSNGIIPFATGVGSWGGASLAEAYQYAYIDMEELTKACLEEPQATYEEIGMVKVLSLFEELAKNDLLSPGISTMDLTSAEQMFANGQVGILYDGSWVIGVLEGMNPDFSNWGVFPLPQPEDAPYEVKLPGGCSWMVISGDADDETLDFMEWLTAKEQQVVYSNATSNLPANTEAVNLDGLKVQASEFADDMDKVYSSVPVNPRAEVAEIMTQGIQMICIGEKTPEEVVREMDAANK